LNGISTLCAFLRIKLQNLEKYLRQSSGAAELAQGA
jgi:hypothetical protein